MPKVNYEVKSQALNLGWDKVVKDYNLAQFNYYFDKDFKTSFTYEQSCDFFMHVSTNSELAFWFHEGEKLNHANFERKVRLTNRIKMLLEKPCIFATLTFTDDILATTNDITRRRYVTRYLKQFGLYVGNKDFGSKNGREHYHAVIQANKIDFSWWQNNCGAIFVEPIRTSKKSMDNLSRYVAKLTNHAIKETCKRSALIYSR